MSLRNRKLIGWKIWYGDGTVLTSRYNKWEECKQDNVQVVKLFYSSDSGIEVNEHTNQEYYLLNDLLEIPPTIKIARAIDGDKFLEILLRARLDEEIVEEMI